MCNDKGLSNLDERLNRTYERVLKVNTPPEALQAEQRRWLRQRDRCVTNGKLDINCLWRHYEVRLYELTKLLPLPDCVTTEQKANLAKQICPEAEFMPNERYKATCLKKQLNQKKITPNENFGKPAPYCPAMLQALITDSPAIEYVEPVLRTSEALHPELIRYRACYAAYVADGGGFEDYRYYIHDFEAHGFQLYRLDLDGNPKNGLEEYLYLEEMSSAMLVEEGNEDTPPKTYPYHRSGYAQLSLPPRGLPTSMDQCMYKDIYDASPLRRERVLLGESGINALLKFRNQYYDYYLSDNQINISPLVRNNRKPNQEGGCIWNYQ